MLPEIHSLLEHIVRHEIRVSIHEKINNIPKIRLFLDKSDRVIDKFPEIDGLKGLHHFFCHDVFTL